MTDLIANGESGASVRAKLNLELGSSYLGQVATRSHLHSNRATGSTRTMSRSFHIARDDITSLQIVLANWFVAWASSPSDGSEANAGAEATLTASIEYPAGTFTQVRWGGATSYAQPDGETTVSDAVTLAIPRGAQFWVRVFRICSAGILYTSFGVASQVDGMEYGGAEITDKTTSGTVASGAGNGFYPCAIIAQTRRPSVIAYGDSITLGVQDAVNDGSADLGQFTRSLGPSFAYINAGIGGDRAQTFASGHAKRSPLAAYASHIICGFGRNDIAIGRTGAQVLADLQTIYALFPGKPVFQSTTVPWTTSSDSWATVTNQTADASEAQRLILNRAIRAVPPGLAGYFDVANALESSPDSGRWATPPGGTTGADVASTTEGVHPALRGYLAVKQSGVVNPGMFRRDQAA